MRRIAVRALQAARLNKVAHKVYYGYFHSFESASSALPDALARCFDIAIERGTAEQGDYFEFGLFKGYSFWCAQTLAAQRNLKDIRFFGFDSFAGLPDVRGVDRTSRNDFYEGQYACAKDAVVRNLDSKGVDWTRTFLIEGYFDRSLTPEVIRAHRMRRATVALIDCDLYASTVDVLTFLRELIGSGTILIFDDWDCFQSDDSKGQRRAFREFLDANPQISAAELFRYGQYGQVFIVDHSPMPQPSVQ